MEDQNELILTENLKNMGRRDQVQPFQKDHLSILGTDKGWRPLSKSRCCTRFPPQLVARWVAMRLPLIFAVTDVAVLPRQPSTKTQTLSTSVKLALLATIQQRERAAPGDNPKRPGYARGHLATASAAP